MAEAVKSDEKPRDVQILDELIERFYGELENQKIREVKIGDLLKMIETRRKLTPQGGDQKEFWKMIDNIRRESLEKPKTRRKTSAKKRPKSGHK